MPVFKFSSSVVPPQKLPATQKAAKKSSITLTDPQKFLFQLKNNALGDYATLKQAKEFKTTMTDTFISKLHGQSKLKQSLTDGKQVQTEIFRQLKTTKTLTLESVEPHINSFFYNKPTPRHLHLSYLGTNKHSVDVIFTKKDNGIYATVCNRGLRSNHDIFETHPIGKNTTAISQLLVHLHQTEKAGGDINAFYNCFKTIGQKLDHHQLIKHEFLPPPATKNQKENNCVRASISAAQKWLAHQHNCMPAHKAVKKELIQELTNAITVIVSPQSPHVQTHSPKSRLHNISDILPKMQEIPPIIQENISGFIDSLWELASLKSDDWEETKYEHKPTDVEDPIKIIEALLKKLKELKEREPTPLLKKDNKVLIIQKITHALADLKKLPDGADQYIK